MSKYLYLLFLTCLMSGFIVPAAAQNGCAFDFTTIRAHLDAAQSAADTGAALAAVSEARSILQLQEQSCYDRAGGDAGDSRTNPVPFGQTQFAKISDEFEGSITLIEFIDDAEDYIIAANERNDPTPDGARYLVYRLNYACERPASDSCEFRQIDFSLVGDKGVSYRYDSADDYDVRIRDIGDDLEVFGGSAVEVDLAFVVPDDDDNFILFTEYGDPRVFFASE